MTIDHISRAKKAWPFLANRANKAGKPYTYGELYGNGDILYSSCQAKIKTPQNQIVTQAVKH